MFSSPVMVGFHSTLTAAITKGLAISYSTAGSWADSGRGQQGAGAAAAGWGGARGVGSTAGRSRNEDACAGGSCQVRRWTHGVQRTVSSLDRKSTRLNSSHVK